MANKLEASELVVKVSVDTKGVVNNIRIITKHLGALADELDKANYKDDCDEKIYEVIKLLNELNDKDLREMTEYAQTVLDCRKG